MSMLGLLFEVPKNRKRGSKFGPPRSRVYLKFWTHTKGGVPLLTPECLSTTELDANVELLHEQLERVKVEARAKYARYYGRGTRNQGKPEVWKPKPRPRGPRIFVPPGGYYSIEPPKVGVKRLDESWALDSEAVNGVSGKGCGLAAVITANSPQPLRRAVEQVAYYFRRESSYDFVQYSAAEEEDDGHRAYVWASSDSVDGNDRVPVVGACCFRWRKYADAPSCFALQWIWFHPHERRKGHLTRAWPYFMARFGNFVPEPPFSPAFERFLLKQLDPAALAEMDETNHEHVVRAFDSYTESVRSTPTDEHGSETA